MRKSESNVKFFNLFNLEYAKIVYCSTLISTEMHNFKIIALRENFIAWKSISRFYVLSDTQA